HGGPHQHLFVPGAACGRPANRPWSRHGVSEIRFEDVCLQYAGRDTAAVNGLSLAIPDGAFAALVGPSGCGKTTALRLVAGFLKPDSGRIVVGDQVLSTSDGVVPPE